MSEWFYEKDGHRLGPVTTAELKKLIEASTVTRDTLIWREGLSDWVKAKAVKGLFPAPAAEPPPLPIKPESGPPPLPPKAALQSSVNAQPDPESGKSEVVLTESGHDAGKAGTPSPGAPLIALLATFSLLVLQVLTGAGSAGDMFGVLGLCAFITSVVFGSIFIYRAWAALPAAYRTVPPGKAIGFCFVPLFNFYWLFVAIRGLAQQTNKALADRQRPERVHDGLALALPAVIAAFPVLIVLGGGIPGLIRLASLVPSAATVLFTLWLLNQAKASAALIGEAVAEAQSRKLMWGTLGAIGLYLVLGVASATGGGTHAGGSVYETPLDREIREEKENARQFQKRLRDIRDIGTPEP